jgi:2',3'-cyclic-nucleotide 2'-phosphodiesterase (5'-nucleotidase family)
MNLSGVNMSRRTLIVGGQKILAGLVVVLLSVVTLNAEGSPANGGSRPGEVQVQLLAFNDYHGHLRKGTPGLVDPTPAGGAEYLATYLKRLRKVVLRKGGFNAGGFNDCVGISGPIVDIAQNLDPEIDAVITGHTHRPYNCSIPDPAGQPRPVTSAFSYGRIVTEMNLILDKRTGDVVRDRTIVTNHVVTQDVAPEPTQTAIIAKWTDLARLSKVRQGNEIAQTTLRHGSRRLDSYAYEPWLSSARPCLRQPRWGFGASDVCGGVLTPLKGPPF